MDVAKYIPPGASVETLAAMQQTEVGRTVLHALRVESERRAAAMKRNPRVNTENMRDDIRYDLGAIDGLEWLERLHKAALNVVSGRAAKEDGE